MIKRVQIFLPIGILFMLFPVFEKYMFSYLTLKFGANNLIEAPKITANILYDSETFTKISRRMPQKKYKSVIDTITSFTANNPYKIEIKDVSDHVGKLVVLESRAYGHDNKRNFALVYLGASYPNQLLTINLRGKCRELATNIDGKLIVVSGEIVLKKNKPEIVISSPEQMTIVSK